MNAVFLLVGLLVLSYLGSLMMARRSGGGAGLASGVEYAALGFVLGPQVLGLVGARDLIAFEPVVQVAIGWLAFAVGVDFAMVDGRRIRAGSLVLGTTSALVTAATVAAAVWAALARLRPDLGPPERRLLAGGLGATCSETTRYAVRWLANRYRLREGALSRRVDEIVHADCAVPVLIVSVLFALDAPAMAVVRAPVWQWPALTFALAVLLGAGAALLLRSEVAVEDIWGVLFGVCLLTIGVATRMSLSALTATFFVGVTLSTLSHHGHELRSMVGPTERPVLLPALLLAGARLDFRATPALPWIAAVVVAARIAAKLLFGGLVLASVPAAARRAGPLVGLSLVSSGAIAMCIGLAFALRFPGTVGDTILVVAVVSAVVGELVGPLRLRRALGAAGEMEDAAARTPISRRVAS